jgi:hypothetical protein
MEFSATALIRLTATANCLMPSAVIRQIGYVAEEFRPDIVTAPTALYSGFKQTGQPGDLAAAMDAGVQDPA